MDLQYKSVLWQSINKINYNYREVNTLYSVAIANVSRVNVLIKFKVILLTSSSDLFDS